MLRRKHLKHIQNATRAELRDRRENLSRRSRPCLEQLEERLVMDAGLPSAIVVGRALSAYTLPDVQNGSLQIVYTVYNEQANEVTGVLLTDTLASGVTLNTASPSPDYNGQELAWSLGTIPGFGRSSVTITVTLGAGLSNPPQLDVGAHAFATLNAGVETDVAPAATLRPAAVDADLLASTPDANTTDPFVQEQAAKLDYNPQAIFAYLNHDVGYESYVGSLRGARGTMWSAAGNSLDETSLGVALFRASGIPARYAHGTLSDPLSQQLILSMFPASFQTVGYLPAGTTVSDPPHDPQLLAETRDHYWLQVDVGSGFVNADTSGLPGGGIGTAFTTAVDTFTEVADSLRHKVRVSLEVEKYSAAAAAFAGGGIGASTVLDQTFNSVDLVGRSLTVSQFVVSNSINAAFLSAATNTYSPYIAIGDEGEPLDQAELIRGTDYQETITNFPLGSQILTGVFMDVELSGPGATTETNRSTLADRIGFDIRQNGGSPNLQVDENTPPLLTEADAFTIYSMSSLGNPHRSQSLPDQIQAASDKLAALPASDPTGSSRQLVSIATQGMTRLFGDILQSASDLQNRRLADTAMVREYSDRPRIAIVSTRLTIDEATGDGKISFAIDLQRDTVRVLADPGQNKVDAGFAFRVARGFLESVLERNVLGSVATVATTPGALSAASVFEAAHDQNIALVALDSDAASSLQGLAISGEAKARITQAFAAGRIVIVPTRSPLIGGQSVIGWYEVNPLTGETIGVSEDGTHGGFLEYTLLNVLDQIQSTITTTARSAVAGIISGQLIGVAYRIASISGDTQGARALAAKAKLDVIDIVDNLPEKADISKELFGLAVEGTVLIFAGVDPPVPTVLVNSSSQLNLPANFATVDQALTASGNAGAITGTVQTKHAQFAGALSSNWTTNTTSSFVIDSLDIPSDATVFSSGGTPLGTGAVSLVGASQSLQIDGNVSYQVNGTGTLSVYPSATSGLGVSGDWTNYAAALEGNGTILLTSGALMLNGVLLSAGTYRITFGHASMAGSGHTSSPTFAGSASITVTGGTVEVGPGTGSPTVGGVAVDPITGITLNGYTGTITLADSGSDTDTVSFNGTAAAVLQVTTPVSGVSLDQNTPATFAFAVRTSISGNYNLTAEAPAGWTVTISNTGQVTVIPAPGTQSGDWAVRLVARSVDNPTLVASAVVIVSVAATQPGLDLAVNSDSILTVPYAGAQLPSAFQASLRNFGPATDTYTLSFANVPAGFSILQSGTAIAVPAGLTGILGLYLQPNAGTALPAPGTVLTFDVTATSNTDAAITQNVTVTFVMPEVHAVTIASTPASVNTTPGTPVNAALTLTAAGNVAETVTLTVTTTPGLSVSGLPTTINLTPGQTVSLAYTVTPNAATPLNSTLAITFATNLGAGALADANQQLFIPVRVVVPGADAIANASSAAAGLGDTNLANRLNDLSIAVTNLVQDPTDAVSKSQALASLDSIESLLRVDSSLVSFVDPFTNAGDGLANAQTAAEIQAAVVDLGQVLDTFADTVTALRHHNVEVSLIGNSLVAQPGVPQSVSILLHNIGDQQTTYDLSLLGLPAGVTGTVSQASVTLEPGQFSTGLFATLTQTSSTELQAFEFQVVATAEGSPTVTKGAIGTMQARAETVSVVSVATTPPFADAGGSIDVTARILNAVNRQQDALASFTVRDPNGALVFTSAPVPFTLTLATSLVTVDLGTFGSTGYANGQYTVTVTIADASGTPIVGAVKDGSVLIGSPVSGSITAGPDTLPPGTNTVTNTLVVANNSSALDAPSVVGVASVPGGSDAIRNGDYVYVGTRTGIYVFNIAGANLNNPQLVRVVDTVDNNIPGSNIDVLLKIRGNLLVAVRGGNDGPNLPNATKLDTYSLTDPASPQFLGTTGDLPFSDAADVMLTDTEAFIVHINLHGFFGFTIYSQTGSVIAINIANPAAPFFDGDAVSASGTPEGRDGVNDGLLFNDYGTNIDGISSNGLLDESGGKNTTWHIVQVSPTIAYVTGSTSTGGDTQTGSGVVHVVDISDPRNMHVIRDLEIPGTVHVVALSVVGNKAFLTGSTGGWHQNSFDARFTGNAVIATLDVSDPANPQIIHSQTLADSSLNIGRSQIVPLAGGLFAYGNQGPDATDPGLFVVDGNDPNNLRFVGLDIPNEIVRMSGGGDLLFTSDGSSLIIYQVHALSSIPVHTEVQVPKNTGVAIVPGSFNVAPTSVIIGTDFDTLVWDVTLDDTNSSQIFTWQSTVTNLQPGESRALTLGSSINFTSQGTPGLISLSATNVAAKQVLSLAPATQTVRPGEQTSYTLSIANPTASDVTYTLTAQGIPQSWIHLPAQIMVPAGSSVDVPFTIQSDPFAVAQNYGFTVTASIGQTHGSVDATLALSGAPILPPAQPQAHGSVVELVSRSATAGQGTSAIYRVRVTNTGSETETFVLSVPGLPAGVTATFAQSSVTVPAGAGNEREVILALTTGVGIAPGAIPFTVTATATTASEVTGTLNVVAQGVTILLDRNAGTPGDSFLLTVTNTGSARDTFDLAAAGPAGLITTLATSSVTLDPGQSQVVTVTTGSANFAVPGDLLLTVGATSRSAPAVQATASVQLRVPTTVGLTAAFTPDSQTLGTPGTVTFILQVNNTGNTEDSYTATIVGANGPIAAQLIGLDGLPTQSISIFRLPGLSAGTIVLQTNLASVGQGHVTVEIRSLSDRSRSATALATVNTGGVGQIDGIVFLDYNADGIQAANEPAISSRPLFIDLNQNGVADPDEPQASPDGTGHYSFDNVTPGTVTLAQNSQPDHGVILIGPAQRQVTVTGGETSGNQNFGVVLISQVSPVEVRTDSATQTGDAADEFVRRLYRNVLGRNAEAAGLGFWGSQLRAANGSTNARTAVVTGIWESLEHRGLQVNHFYATFFGRSADPEGRAYWSGQLQSGSSETDVVLRFVTSAEYHAKWSTDDTLAQHLYEDVLSREGSTAELTAARSDLLTKGVAAVARELINSDESYLRIVDGYYAALLHRAGEEGGRQFWLSHLQAVGETNLSPGAVAEQFFYLPEYYDQGANAEA